MSLFSFKESMVNRIFAISIVPSMIVILLMTAIFYCKSANLVESEIMLKQLPAQLGSVTQTIKSEVQPYITQSKMMAISVYTLILWFLDHYPIVFLTHLIKRWYICWFKGKFFK